MQDSEYYRRSKELAEELVLLLPKLLPSLPALQIV
jgi:hypothetical protein